VVAGILGTIQAAEALKYVLAKGELLTNRLLVFNALQMNFRTVVLNRNSDCPVCGSNASIKELVDEEETACDLREVSEKLFKTTSETSD
jgi:adenylyltransferase/sulfurtransferase